ncbi:hypothetical protein HZA40_04755 [Candidatus Peregrinibacteria bacterium]|nr:hypothetical protein [Candidatus Peregrinibacteria bacterium]
MKKFLNVPVFVLVLFSLTSCGSKGSDVEKQAAVQKQVDQLKEQVGKLKDEQDGVKPEDKKVVAKQDSKTGDDKIQVKESSISVNNPKDGDKISQDPITFSGAVSDGATKIVVTANGGTKNEDVYTLTGFKKGDKKFSYKASKSFSNLVNGSNIYEFKAYFSDGTVKATKVTINFSK